jgi:DNA-binding transcriptional MerR regulator
MTQIIFESDPETGFVIGAVSRATGIPVETLRAWERRYQIVTPQRNADNKRYYTATDVQRLKLVKQLVDKGHAVSSVASLDEAALQDRLKIHADIEGPGAVPRAIRVMVCGEILPGLSQSWDLSQTQVEMAGAYASYAEFEREALAAKPDILMLETTLLQPELLHALADLAALAHAGLCVVIYSYAPAALLAAGRKLGLRMQRGPLNLQGFMELCLWSELAPPKAEPFDLALPPGRRFDGGDLAKITSLSTTVRCECPHHLADLVFRIQAFERYSADCQNRNEQDAAIHAHLHLAAGRARAIFEEALVFLLESEGIDLAAIDAQPPNEGLSA